MATRKSKYKNIPLFKMNVGQVYPLNYGKEFVRVPGGLVFNQHFDNNATSVFIPEPYDIEEVQPKA